MSEYMRNTILILSGVVVIVLIGAAVYFLQASHISAVVGLPMLSIGAVVLLMIILTLTAVVFASFDLQDKAQALALPEGSIRAVIALMLIVLFAILSIYLYGSIASGQTSHLGVVDKAVRDTLVNTYGESNVLSVAVDGQRFEVWLQRAASSDGVDFAKQLLVLVGTLVTSICSFYFGSKAVLQSADRMPNITVPLVETITPSTYKRGDGPQNFTIEGSGLERITGVKLTRNGKQVAATAIKASANNVQFKLEIATDQENGVWSMTVTDSKLGEQATTQGLVVS
ncbi:hypothetical protein FHX06_006343 [Rhizobium sp. BK512]|uniref:hypothetical protein n=1 Tax=Rhizobium sp. BK512 TaxID=2587010 RepID=UPI000DE1567E|nr:hypothetical protein [Rhizobium sp. BK512]MBB3564973.1 hypothetical protein [Rhizobium sp. BK512]